MLRKLVFAVCVYLTAFDSGTQVPRKSILVLRRSVPVGRLLVSLGTDICATMSFPLLRVYRPVDNHQAAQQFWVVAQLATCVQ